MFMHTVTAETKASQFMQSLPQLNRKYIINDTYSIHAGRLYRQIKQVDYQMLQKKESHSHITELGVAIIFLDTTDFTTLQLYFWPCNVTIFIVTLYD